MDALWKTNGPYPAGNLLDAPGTGLRGAGSSESGRRWSCRLSTVSVADALSLLFSSTTTSPSSFTERHWEAGGTIVGVQDEPKGQGYIQPARQRKARHHRRNNRAHGNKTAALARAVTGKPVARGATQFSRTFAMAHKPFGSRKELEEAPAVAGRVERQAPDSDATRKDGTGDSRGDSRGGRRTLTPSHEPVTLSCVIVLK